MAPTRWRKCLRYSIVKHNNNKTHTLFMKSFLPLNIHYPPRAQVGETVYYRSPVNRYAVKRSVVVEIILNASEQSYEQVMRNGDIVTKRAGLISDCSTFTSLESAISHIMATLVERVNHNRVSIDSLLYEQHKLQRVLEMMRKQHPGITPQRHDYDVPMSAEELEGLFYFNSPPSDP